MDLSFTQSSSQSSSATLFLEDVSDPETVYTEQEDTPKFQQAPPAFLWQSIGPVRSIIHLFFSLAHAAITAKHATAYPVSFSRNECYHRFRYDPYSCSWSEYLPDCFKRHWQLHLGCWRYCTSLQFGCSHYSRTRCWLLRDLVCNLWTIWRSWDKWALFFHRDLASQYVLVIGAAYSFHSTIRDARICYLRSLIGGMVCLLYDEGLSECVVSPCIPEGWSRKRWWKRCWRLWDAEEGIDLPTPRIKP